MGGTFVLCSIFALLTLSAFTEAQRGAKGAQAEGPAALLNLPPPLAQGPITDLSQAGTGSAGAIYNNRSLGAMSVVPPNGCLIVTITGADQVCLQDADFKVNFNSIAKAADYKKYSLPNSFSKANYAANNSACAKATPQVTQIYEKTGCILSDAVKSTTGLNSTSIPNSFVCESSGVDTTSTSLAYPAEVCKQALKLATQAVKSGDAVSESGNPCTASRATYIITNPCMDQNTVVNGTARFFLAEEPVEAPAPAPGPDSELAPGPELVDMAPGLGVAGAEGADSPSGAMTPASESADSPAASAAAAAAAADAPDSSDASCATSSPSVVAGFVLVSYLAMAA